MTHLQSMYSYAGLLAFALVLACEAAPAQTCQNEECTQGYPAVLAPEHEGLNAAFMQLPGFTRSVYNANFALVTPESRVWSSNPAWPGASTAHLISPASGAHFSMYFVRMKAGATCVSDALPDAPQLQRFILVLEGSVTLTSQTGLSDGSTAEEELAPNAFAFMAPSQPTGKQGMRNYTLRASGPAGLVVYERYVMGAMLSTVDPEDIAAAQILTGVVDEQTPLDTGVEMFALRKLLPERMPYVFNIHIMDFEPGEHLVVKEVHYNQHGLVLLEGQGIYRLADYWVPVKPGDAIWMAPFVPQWYAALGKQRSRYILYKDVHIDPLLS